MVLRGTILLIWLVCFRVHDVFGQGMTITTSSPLPDGVVNALYPQQQLMATGGTATRMWQVVPGFGTLPPGLSLASATGVISGTPTATGTSNFRVRVMSGTASGEKDFALKINTAVTIVSGPGLPNATQGASYSQNLVGSGGTAPYSWLRISGTLPNGLSLSSGGTISGTPNQTGPSSFTVQITDSSSPPQTTTKAMTLIVVALTITTASPLPMGATSTPYSQALTVVNGTAPYTFSLVSNPNSLPAGLMLSASGVISGTPTATGTSNFTVQVRDSSTPTSASAQKSFQLQIVPQLNITTTSPMTTALINVVYSQTVTATGGTSPYTLSLVPGLGTLPVGLSQTGQGGRTISGTPTTVGTSNFTLRITDSSSPPLTTDKAFVLDVVVPLMITTTSPLPAGTAGVAYSQNLGAAGGLAPYSWSVITGTPPDGVNLTNGTLSGIPATAGTSNFTIRVLDSSTPPQNFQRNFSLTINTVLTITTSSLPGGVTGTAYSQNLVSAGGTAPFTWSISAGSLPPGLTLSGATITGTPNAVTSANFTVKVTDSSSQTAQRDLSIFVLAPLTITTSSPLPPAIAGVAYSQALAGTGGTPPLSWAKTSGDLPPGVTLSPEGAITGTPTQAGSFSFTATVGDSSSLRLSASAALQLSVAPFLTITTASVPSGAVGSSYSVQLLAVSGDVGPTWSITSGGLPPGISLSNSGLLTGTPTAVGPFSFTVRATTQSPSQEATRSYQIIVSSALSLTTTTTPQATRFVPYTAPLAAAGGVAPYTWTVLSGNLPTGLSLSSAGVISGTPTAVSTSNFTIQVADAGGATASRAFSIAVIQGVLQITTLSLPGGIQGFAYSQQLQASGGPTPFTWSLAGGTLPTGFALTSAGVLQGNATAPYSGTLSVRVMDASGATDTRDLTLALGPPLGTLSLNGVAARISPVQQIPVSLSIPSAYPAELRGTVTFAFASSAVVPADDPAVQFSTGGRTVNFTIPANTTNAVFPSSLMLVTGTVAGTVTMTGAIQNGPSGLALLSTTIDSGPPRMTTITATRITGGLSVRVIGYSPERRVTEVEYSFDVRVNGVVEKVNLGRAVLSEFNTWYQNPASAAFGSAFRLEQLFSVVGDSTAIEAVTVTLKNSQGNAISARTPFTAN
jgi:hypothetical protein